MAWASEHDRVVLTADLGFAAEVARQQLAAPTIIQLRCGSTDPSDVGRHVLDAIAVAEPELTSGAILTIEEDRARLRPGHRLGSDEP